MRRILLSFTILVYSTTALAQDHVEAATTEALNRKALLKSAIARERGEISAMESSSEGGQGVIIGYSSGAVLNCYNNHSCKEFGGTPNAAVEHIAVTKRGKSEIIWVSYPQGSLYHCISNSCRKFRWDDVQDE
jgi:hypothetical protein